MAKAKRKNPNNQKDGAEMYIHNNFQKVKDKIAARRQNAEAASDARRREVADLSPEVAAIDEELRTVGPQIFRAACAGEDITPIKEKNLALSEKRRQLIAALGFPENYTDAVYTCKICNDTGYDGMRLCSCFKELLTIENIASSGIGNLIEKQSFENFDLSWYGENTEERKKAELNLKAAKSYAQNFGKAPANLLLIGTTGTGKTHISTSIAKAVITRGFEVVYDSAQNIISDFEDDKFRSGYSASYEPKSEKYLECDLLILDDLGSEFVTQFTCAELFRIINNRLLRGGKMIISTNLNRSMLKNTYNERIASRISGSFSILEFLGDDIRRIKKLEGKM